MLENKVQIEAGSASHLEERPVIDKKTIGKGFVFAVKGIQSKAFSLKEKEKGINQYLNQKMCEHFAHCSKMQWGIVQAMIHECC